ncbi:MAG TPA: sortase B protein-sorting domain-containing protein [Vicinamibacterales bacterium]|nr:sortase B protein-sorting domain-containing protein [Vicinamibacterales bacterium]
MNASTLVLYAVLAVVAVLYMARRRNRLKSEE